MQICLFWNKRGLYVFYIKSNLFNFYSCLYLSVLINVSLKSGYFIGNITYILMWFLKNFCGKYCFGNLIYFGVNKNNFLQ